MEDLVQQQQNVCGIYCIENIINHRKYIGQSRHIQRRWQEHKHLSVWEKHPNRELYQDFSKYGIENFSFTVLEECPLRN